MAANPSVTEPLRLDKESKAIDTALQTTTYRDRFEIKQQWAVSVAELQGLLQRHQPHIVHFSGHGSSSGDIILETSSRGAGTGRSREILSQEQGSGSGQTGHVSPRALSELFRLLKGNIRCVLLNACYSEDQAKGIAEHIDCVIGMNTTIGDAAAIEFAASFYQALGYGQDVQTAFGLGRNQIDLSNLNEQDTPQLLALKSNPQDIVFEGLPKKGMGSDETAQVSQQATGSNIAQAQGGSTATVTVNKFDLEKNQASYAVNWEAKLVPESHGIVGLQIKNLGPGIANDVEILADGKPLKHHPLFDDKLKKVPERFKAGSVFTANDIQMDSPTSGGADKKPLMTIYITWHDESGKTDKWKYDIERITFRSDTTTGY